MENQTGQNVNPTPQVSPDVQTPPSTPPVSNPSNPRWQGLSLPKIAIGIILFLLIAGSTAGFYVFRPQIEQFLSRIAPDPTANWKTYTDQDIGYSVKYPASWNVKYGTFLPQTKSKYPFVDSITISAIKKQLNNNVIPDSAEDYAGVKNFYKMKITKIITKTGFEGYKVDMGQNVYAGPEAYNTYFALPNDKSHILVISLIINGYTYKPSSNIYERLISTFKFTNPTQAYNPIHNWSTFTSVDKKFEFKHPSSFFPATLADNSVLLQFQEMLPQHSSDDKQPGYKIAFTTRSIGSGNLKNLVEVNDIKQLGYSTILQDLREIKIGAYSGYTFTGVLKDVAMTNVYLQEENNSYVKISYSVYDKDDRGYGEQVENILSTFKFTN